MIFSPPPRIFFPILLQLVIWILSKEVFFCIPYTIIHQLFLLLTYLSYSLSLETSRSIYNYLKFPVTDGNKRWSSQALSNRNGDSIQYLAICSAGINLCNFTIKKLSLCHRGIWLIGFDNGAVNPYSSLVNWWCLPLDRQYLARPYLFWRYSSAGRTKKSHLHSPDF